MHISNPLSTVQVLNVGALAKDSHAGARVERPHVRTKTYIKDFHAALRTHPRFWPFLGMPVLAAASQLNVRPIECNEAAIVNFARCNMGCWFCFGGELLDAGEECVDEVTITDLWSEVMEQYEEDMRHDRPWHILRVTGGEPLLQQNELQALVEWRKHSEASGGPPMYLWVDTNLGAAPTDELLTRLVEIGEPMGVVCCFKGFTSADVQNNTSQGVVSLDDQFAIAYEWWQSGLDVYFYVVDCTQYTMQGTGRSPQELAESFIDRMMCALDRDAPLKTCPIEINERYACQTREKPKGLVCNTIGPYWEHAMHHFYSAEELWTLPHLVRVVEE